MPISGGTPREPGTYRPTDDGLFIECWDGNKWVRELSANEQRMMALMREVIRDMLDEQEEKYIYGN
jgi:hypothetical protein